MLREYARESPSERELLEPFLGTCSPLLCEWHDKIDRLQNSMTTAELLQADFEVDASHSIWMRFTTQAIIDLLEIVAKHKHRLDNYAAALT